MSHNLPAARHCFVRQHTRFPCAGYDLNRLYPPLAVRSGAALRLPFRLRSGGGLPVVALRLRSGAGSGTVPVVDPSTSLRDRVVALRLRSGTGSETFPEVDPSASLRWHPLVVARSRNSLRDRVAETRSGGA